VETVAAVFTDRLAVCPRVNLEVSLHRRDRGLWKLNRMLVDDTAIRFRFQQQWTRCLLQKKNCLDILTWWEKYEKRNIRMLFVKEGTEKIA
jgi:hypothetical protein